MAQSEVIYNSPDSPELFEDSESQYEDVPFELPDLEETQIVDAEEDKREVSLFTAVKSGKVVGAEFTPFLLPHRWTYNTLKGCVEHYVNRSNTGGGHRKIKQLYYKTARGKGVVLLDGDGDIPALIREYPLCYPSGEKKTGKGCLMYLAIDLEEESSVTPRRSLRINKNHLDIFVYIYDDGKVNNTAQVIHNVEKNSTLEKITELLLLQNKGRDAQDSMIYTPQRGLYWLRRGTRNPIVLKTNEDLEACKKEYATSIRIACAVVNVSGSTPAAAAGTGKKRRRLEINTEKGDQEKKTENEIWNDMHVQLVRDLEKKGLLWRYTTKHLRLWTDLLVDGKISGIGEEPQWDQYMEQVIIPPKQRSTSPSVSSNSSNGSVSNSIMELLLLQNQQRIEAESRRAELFQSTMMTMMSSSFALLQNQSSLGRQVSSTPETTLLTAVEDGIMPIGTSTPSSRKHSFNEKDLKFFTLDDCCQFLSTLGLSHLADTFKENKMDGPLLLALVNPFLGPGMLETMGLTKSEQDILTRAIRDNAK